MVKREQAYYILGAVLLTTLLFFGFDTKPSTQKALEKSRVLNTQEFDVQTLQAEAKKDLKADQLEYLETLESQAQFAKEDSVRINLLKQMSGFWFQVRKPLLAGLYARQVAEKEQTATSWSIAGTSFAAALTTPGIEEKDKVIAREQAVTAFENAISLEPRVIEHRINQALCYIEAPDETQPMKGVQMLAGLAEKNPESPLPTYHLARLALKTGQVERAVERIEQALAKDPTNARIACLAIDIYTAVGRPEDARKWSGVCATTE